MIAAVLLLALAATPFWEARQPKDWTEDELRQMLVNSPWARAEVYLASATPMKIAEEEWRRRHIAKQFDAPEPAEDDYFEFIRNNPGKHIILAVRVDDFNQLLKAEEVREMEKSCVLKSGKQKLKVSGHFPPSSHDPVLRLVFPRPQTLDKTLKFELYLPGVAGTFRQVEFYLKEMSFQGKPEY